MTKTFGVEAKEDMVQFELARDDAVLRRAMAQREAKEAAEEQIEHKAAILESENWKAVRWRRWRLRSCSSGRPRPRAVTAVLSGIFAVSLWGATHLMRFLGRLNRLI